MRRGVSALGTSAGARGEGPATEDDVRDAKNSLLLVDIIALAGI
jgi:hypothetical protein